MIAVEFRGVSKEYHHRLVLDNINLAVEAGTFTVFFGPPACGKSVLVRLLTGLEKPSAGQIFLRGMDASRMSPGERNIGYVPQSFALYPHYSVYNNIAYPLKLLNVSRREIDPVVRQTAELLRISPLLDKRPDQLSGGEKQRVAIARGIVKNTELFVLDDPLTGLDFKLREQLFDDLRQMQEALDATFVYTTSDPLEALMLSEYVAIFDAGRLVETGALEAVYAQPKHVRTMQLLGYPQTNLIEGQVTARDGQLWCRAGLFEFPVRLNGQADAHAGQGAVTVTLRSEDIRLDPKDVDGLVTCPARVVLREDLGSELLLHLEANSTVLLAVVRHEDMHAIDEERVTIGVHPGAMVLYAPGEGQRIGQGA